ncbi:hypothetical protein EVAR_49853_1 [Eumeta japonica]|uniref:Uncharacterized protein n=1 Tax=Eumeta variegata TaxID=151549 RepID=A0A4C1XYY7_EUMVA|nr:hypothetical protein EVAR_49853_1 [Eumeta japonica]
MSCLQRLRISQGLLMSAITDAAATTKIDRLACYPKRLAQGFAVFKHTVRSITAIRRTIAAGTPVDAERQAHAEGRQKYGAKTGGYNRPTHHHRTNIDIDETATLANVCHITAKALKRKECSKSQLIV